jgi:hypothetical protein
LCCLPGSRPGAPPALRLAGLHKTFRDKVAGDHIDLTVPRGSFFGLVGPDGAGKTTALSTGMRKKIGLATAVLSSHVMALVEHCGGERHDPAEAQAAAPLDDRQPGQLGDDRNGGWAGITTLVALLAFTSLVVFAARLGVAAALMAVPAVILQLALVVLLSRVAMAGFGSASKSRTPPLRWGSRGCQPASCPKG